ncbi:MAG: hypothetical protein H6702_12010 [Myxococcales bacterium]|nr:hypothetical protein [Myxococcales bacterium]
MSQTAQKQTSQKQTAQKPRPTAEPVVTKSAFVPLFWIFVPPIAAIILAKVFA